MLDRSSKLDDSLMDAYRSIHEIHKGHAAGDSDVDKQASQLASDIRYKAKGRMKDGMNTEDKKKIYLKLLASSPAPGIVKSKAKRKLLGESVIGEEGYDHWRDKHLERGGIGAVASKSPSRPYTRSGKQPKGDTAYQKEMKAKHGGKLPSALDVVKSKIEKEHGKGAIMKTEETLSAADKIINSIRSKRVDEGKLVHGPFGPYITGQKMPKEHREVPLRKVPYEDINSAKKVVEDAKMGRQSDEKLASLQKQFSGMDQSTPSNQHMLKRVNREINRRKKQKSVEEEVTNEAKVDQKLPEYKRATARDKRYGNPHGSHELGGGIRKDRRADHEKRRGVKEEVANEAKVDKVKHGDHNLYDNPGKEKDRNERKFGKQSFNQKGQTQLRRGLHWSKRGEKKVKGAKVEEEVGVSSSAAMTKARQEAELKSKEEAAVKKAKKAKNEEVAPAVEKVIESIKINKASPKSPNCIIMPKKDDIADKAGGNGRKSTKEVVTKKQKQFFNQEDTVKTFRQFVTEAEQVDEGVGKLVGSLAGAGSKLAKKGAKEVVRVAGDVSKHAPQAIQKGADSISKSIDKGGDIGSSIKKGVQTGRIEYQKGKIGADYAKRKSTGKTGVPSQYRGSGTGGDINKQAARAVKKSDVKWARRAKSVGMSGQLASNIDTATGILRGGGGGGGKKGPGTAPLKGAGTVRAGEGAG